MLIVLCSFYLFVILDMSVLAGFGLRGLGLWFTLLFGFVYCGDWFVAS